MGSKIKGVLTTRSGTLPEMWHLLPTRPARRRTIIVYYWLSIVSLRYSLKRSTVPRKYCVYTHIDVFLPYKLNIYRCWVRSRNSNTRIFIWDVNKPQGHLALLEKVLTGRPRWPSMSTTWPSRGRSCCGCLRPIRGPRRTLYSGYKYKLPALDPLGPLPCALRRAAVYVFWHGPTFVLRRRLRNTKINSFVFYCSKNRNYVSHANHNLITSLMTSLTECSW